MNDSKETNSNKILSFMERYYYPLLAIVFIVLIFNLLYRINIPNISFDEARHGTSAYEMIKMAITL